MIDEPPGLFSTITGTLRDRASLCAIARAWMSVCPPGGNGTTMRTGFPAIGNCAWAAPATRKKSRQPSLMMAASLYSRADAGAFSAADRLPDRGDHRDAVSPRRGAAHRRHLGLYRAPAARAAREAARVGLPQREAREDPGIEAGPRARLFRPAGRHRARPGEGRPQRHALQPALGPGDFEFHPVAVRARRRAGEGCRSGEAI